MPVWQKQSMAALFRVTKEFWVTDSAFYSQFSSYSTFSILISLLHMVYHIFLPEIFAILNSGISLYFKIILLSLLFLFLFSFLPASLQLNSGPVH